MSDTTRRHMPPHPDAAVSKGQSAQLPVLAFGMGLATFFAITFTLCVAFDLLFPGMAMYETWSKFLPGFSWLSWPSFFLGLAQSFAYGWYVALIFGPLFNFFSARWSR